MPTYLSKSQFAETQGWSPSYVTKLGKSGRLMFAPDGKRVDVEATLQLIGQTADPSRDGVRERHQHERVQRDAKTPPAGDELPAGGGGQNSSDYYIHKAAREKYLAGIAKIEFDKLRRETVERQPVVEAAYRSGRLLRDTVLGVPKQIAAEVASMGDAWEVERLLTDKLRKALEDVIRAVNDDLDHVME